MKSLSEHRDRTKQVKLGYRGKLDPRRKVSEEDLGLYFVLVPSLGEQFYLVS